MHEFGDLLSCLETRRSGGGPCFSDLEALILEQFPIGVFRDRLGHYGDMMLRGTSSFRVRGRPEERTEKTMKRHIDEEKVQLERDAARVIRSGTLDEFREILRKAGADPDSPKGRALVDRFIALGADGHSRQ
jgi:hypothetical protein